MEKTYNCDFCKKTFSTNTILQQHQKTAKYCLRLRGQELENTFQCKDCLKNFTNKNRLSTHIPICKKILEAEYKNVEKEHEILKKQFKKEKEEMRKQFEKENKSLLKQLEEEKERNKQLQETLSKIAMNSKGNTTLINTNSNNSNNNNKNNYTLNLNDSEAMSKFLDENLDKNVVGGGQKALAQLISNKYLKAPDGKDLYVCTDPSRQMFEFTNTDGYVEKDVKANKLKRAMIDGKVHTKAAEIGPQLWIKEDGSFDTERQNYYILRVTEIMNIENDDQKFRGELALLKS